MKSPEPKRSGVICFEVRDQIGILTIDNGTQNKINQADFLETALLQEWLDKEQCRGLIIQGKGRHFSAGADVDNIKANMSDPDFLQNSLKKGKEMLNYIEKLPIITVAAISGACFGAGLEIALSCHYRICTANGMLALPESNLGIMPGLGGTLRLAKKIGREKALEMILSGRTVAPEEALTIGLIDQAVANKTHQEAAIKLIQQLTQGKSLQQINYIVQSVNNGIYEAEEVALEKEGQLFIDLVKNFND